MPYVLTDPPEGEPVSLAEAKAHLRVEVADDDLLITSLIAAARQYVERETNRSLLSQVWRLDLDDFPRAPIALGHGPVAELGDFTYHDTADALQTLSTDDYVADALPADSPRLVPSPSACAWPCALRQPGAVSIEFTAGYGAADDVPNALKLAILMTVANWYANREATTAGPLTAAPLGAQCLMDQFKIRLLS